MFSGFTQISPNALRDISSTKNGIPLGVLGIGRDSKIYAWSKAGGSGLATGKLTVNADPNSDVVNKTVARTYTAGAMQIIVDAGGTIVADAYADGNVTISDATGEGHEYGVVSNTGVTGAGEITLNLQDPLVEALTIDVSEYTLQKNLYDSVVISATDQLDAPTGVANLAVTASYYFWSQLRGDCAVLADASTHARGSEITISAATAGAVGIKDAAGEAKVGIENNLLVSTEYRAAFLSML